MRGEDGGAPRLWVSHPALTEVHPPPRLPWIHLEAAAETKCKYADELTLMDVSVSPSPSCPFLLKELIIDTDQTEMHLGYR